MVLLRFTKTLHNYYTNGYQLDLSLKMSTIQTSGVKCDAEEEFFVYIATIGI